MRTLLLTLLFTLPTLADAPKPSLELRIPSVTKLSESFEYLGGLGGQAEQGKQFAELVKAFGGAKGVIEGVDLKKPIGAYAVLSPGMIDSQLVVFLPVADETAFVNLLKSRLNIDAKKTDDVYEFSLPKVPMPFFFRMHEGYACVTLMDAKNIGPKKLIEPKVFFDAPVTSLIDLQLHIDRIPAEFRKVVLGQLELKLADALNKKDANAGDRFNAWLGREAAMRSAKALMDDGRTLALSLNAVPNSDDVTLNITLTPRDGTDLAKTLIGLPKRSAFAALAAAAENPVVSFALKAGIPDSILKDFRKHLDEALNEAVQNAGAQKDVVDRLMDAFGPTLRSGDYEFGVAITGEAKDGGLTLVAAAKAEKGKEIENLAKEFRSFIPEDVAKFEFDIAKLPGGSLHKLSVVNDDLKRLYGSETVWAGIGDHYYILGFEKDGVAAKKAANLKPGMCDVLSLSIAGTRLIPLVDPSVEPAVLKNITEAVYPDAVKPGSDTATLTIKGGDTLVINLTVKGKLLEFLAKLDAKKKEK